MSETVSVAVVVGSLRKASFSRRLAKALVSVAPAHMTFNFVEIGALQNYNQDLDDEKTPTPEWTAFRAAMNANAAVLFVTPEYNRSVPGVLKNAIDVGSRPYGSSVWSGKPAAVVSNSPGALSGFGANHHLRQSLVFLDMPTMQQPEAYIGHVASLLTDDDKPADEKTAAFFTAIMGKFAAWIEATKT